MEQWKKDGRKDVVMVDLDGLVPKDHLLRRIEKVMDYDWLCERLTPYYCHDNGRPGTDPVVQIKMVLIQHLFGIPLLVPVTGIESPAGTRRLRRRRRAVSRQSVIAIKREYPRIRGYSLLSKSRITVRK